MISQDGFRRRLKIFGYDARDPNNRITNFPKIRILDEDQSRAYKWCQENFGDEWIWACPINTNYTDIYFLHPEDALLFKLRFNTITTT